MIEDLVQAVDDQQHRGVRQMLADRVGGEAEFQRLAEIAEIGEQIGGAVAVLGDDEVAQLDQQRQMAVQASSGAPACGASASKLQQHEAGERGFAGPGIAEQDQAALVGLVRSGPAPARATGSPTTWRGGLLPRPPGSGSRPWRASQSRGSGTGGRLRRSCSGMNTSAEADRGFSVGGAGQRQGGEVDRRPFRLGALAVEGKVDAGRWVVVVAGALAAGGGDDLDPLVKALENPPDCRVQQIIGPVRDNARRFC